MSTPHEEAGQAPPVPTNTGSFPNTLLTTKVSELACVCAALAMAPPEFSFIHNRQQGLVVCQVKLSSGLMVHGPQCQSENDAKEKAAFFALQRLNSVGSGFPPHPCLYPGMGQIRPPPLFNPAGGLLLPPQGYPPAPLWGMAFPPHHPQNQAFYRPTGTFPGAGPPQPPPSVPIGSHNQFIPLQVTKKRASANKKSQDTVDGFSGARNPPQRTPNQQTHAPAEQKSPAALSSPSTAEPVTPQKQTPPATTRTPGSASKGRHRNRKLAVNFEAAKISE
ncbi:5'-3' exoribonuclease 1-like [Neosynchiropus ocellatus]